MTQFTSGTPLAQQYGNFGIANRRMFPPPSRLYGLLLGLSNCGKTSFLLQNPAALIINTDMSSTPDGPSPNAQIWPGYNDNGDPIDVDGKPLILDWSAVRRLCDRLVDAAAKQQPRPEMVVFDSALTAVSLLKPWVLARINARGSGNDKREMWADADGRQAWELLYAELENQCNRLRQAGYGVWLTAHLDMAKDGDSAVNSSPRILMSSGFMSRLYPKFELAMVMERYSQTKQILKEGQTKDGKPVTFRENVEVPRYRLVFRRQDLNGIAKLRRNIDESIDVDANTGWSDFERLYRESKPLDLTSNGDK